MEIVGLWVRARLTGVGHGAARAGVPAFARNKVANVRPGDVVFSGCLSNSLVSVGMLQPNRDE